MTVLPLQGIRVLDHGHVWAGPLLGGMFVDMGAEVIKVQAPNRLSGVAMGGAGSPAGIMGRADVPRDHPLAYHSLERGKLSITLDLSLPEGKELYKRLAAITDVIVENFAPRVMPGLGLGYDVLSQVNPRLIMASLSAAGATPGPWRDAVTYGPSLAAMYGVKSLLGYHDDPQPREDTADLDPTAAAHAFFAICAALEYRERTGKGQFIDVAQGEATVQRIAEPIMDYFFNGRVAGPQGNRYPGMAPHGVYRCSGDDRWISIVVRDDSEWSALVSIGGDDEPRLKDGRFTDAFGRLKHQDELDAIIEAWTQRHDARELTHTLQAAGVAAFPVMSPPDLLADPNYEALRGRHIRIEAAPSITPDQMYQSIPWKLTRTPGAVLAPTPKMGEHNDYVYGKLLGLSTVEMEQLKERGVI